MVEWSYVHWFNSTYQLLEGSAMVNVSISSWNLPPSMWLVVRFSTIFLHYDLWHDMVTRPNEGAVVILFSRVSFWYKWRRKGIYAEKHRRSLRRDDQVTRHRQFREWRKAGVVPTVNLATDTPQLALIGELWGVYCEDVGKNWRYQNGNVLYCDMELIRDCMAPVKIKGYFPRVQIHEIS